MANGFFGVSDIMVEKAFNDIKEKHKSELEELQNIIARQDEKINNMTRRAAYFHNLLDAQRVGVEISHKIVEELEWMKSNIK